MKKLLLFALPICLFAGCVIRAEEAVQPATTQQDPDITAFQAVMSDFIKECQPEFNSLQMKLIKAFEGDKMKILVELAKKYPEVVRKAENGDSYFCIQFGVGAIPLPQ